MFSKEILDITLLSIFVSGSAVIIASIIGVPLGAFIGLKDIRGKSIIKTITYTMYGFPPVVIGLLVYLIVSGSGPLGFLDLIFTPGGMIMAQTLLVLPLVTGITISSVTDVSSSVKDTARTLGANDWQLTKTVIQESRVGVFTGIMVGFGRAIAEVGTAIIVGGNIRGHTRVLTTAIVLETRRGHFDLAISLGIILIAVSMVVFYVLYRFQEK